jgi:hypothetical protein
MACFIKKRAIRLSWCGCYECFFFDVPMWAARRVFWLIISGRRKRKNRIVL